MKMLYSRYSDLLEEVNKLKYVVGNILEAPRHLPNTQNYWITKKEFNDLSETTKKLQEFLMINQEKIIKDFNKA